MANDYLDSLTKLTRKRQLKLTKEQEKEIAKVYMHAAESYSKRFMSTIGNRTATNALQFEYARELHTKLSEIVKEYSIKGAENSLNLGKRLMEFSYAEYGISDTPYGRAVQSITNVLKDSSARRIILGDIYKDGHGLDDRLWKAVNSSGNKINEVIASCLAQQLSATETSKILKDFLKPGKNTTWDRQKIREKLGPGYAAWNKDISYESLRLARTTISHSATLGMKEASKVNPYLNKAIWHSVHAIGRTCDICKERDGQVYTLAKLPFDHPNGLCWHEPILDKSLDEIGNELADWVKGGKNSRLDEYWKTHGPKDVPVPSKLNKQQKQQTTQVNKKQGNQITPGTPEWYDKKYATIKDEVGEHWENGIREKIMNAPEFIQNWYRLNQHHMKYLGAEGNDAYYTPVKKGIVMNFKNDSNNSRGEYSTFFHEFGHLLDDKGTNLDGRKMSLQVRFYKAIERDFEMKKLEYEGKPWPYIKGKITEELRKDGDYASGCQDIIGGLTLNEIRAGWGHSTSYWKRQPDKRADINSEMFAHMSSAFTNPKRLEVMKKWFPRATKEFERMVTKSIKSLL